MSIARIAQAANVSYATAWRIINNHPCSSDAAIRAVKRAMRQIGYEPSNGATATATARRRGRPAKSSDGIRTHNIALLHFREGTAISTSVLSSVQRMLAERNLNLIFGQVDHPETLPQAVRAGNVDGVLGYGQFPATAVTANLQRVPAVWMMSRWDNELDSWGDRVKPDHLAIGQLAAKYLLDRGHRHLGFLNPDGQFVVYQQRVSAFRMECERVGVPAAVYSGNAGGRGGMGDMEGEIERLVDEWLASNPRPTGLFVPVDRLTLQVYRHLQKRGLVVGRDVEIVSCDNERELLGLMHPAPVSIDLNRQTIARLAVERLFWRMRNGMDSPKVVVTVTPTFGGDASTGIG
jgi:DNA-binding LacI/PurR family transcriptional regulator